MSFRNKTEQGVKISQDHRTGVGQFPPLRGVKKSRNPASIADNQFDHLQNVRIKKGVVRERGGLEKACTNAFPGVQGIHDASDIGTPFSENYVLPPPLLLEAIFQVTANPVSGAWFSYALDETATTSVALPTTGIATFARPFSTIGKLLIGTLYASFGADFYLYKWSEDVGLEVALTFNVDFPNTSYPGNGVSSGVQFGSNFYFSVWYEDNLVSPFPHHLLIYRWDGVNAPVLELDYEVPWPDAGIFNTWALYADGLDVYALMVAASFAGNSDALALGNIIKKRSGGSWTNLTMPGTTYFGVTAENNTGVSYGAVVRFQGATYIAGHDQSAQAAFSQRTLQILKCTDGGALTVEWSRLQTDYHGQINLFVADDVLYYNYSDSTAGVYKTGSYDGATWDDDAKIWTAAPQSLSLIPNNVVDFAGELWASLGEFQTLRKTVARDVLGTWVATTGDIDNANFLQATS